MSKTTDFDGMVQLVKGAQAPQQVADKVEEALGALPARDEAPKVKVVPGGKRRRAGRARWMPAAVAACAALAVCLVAVPAIQGAGDAGAGQQAGQEATPVAQIGRAFAVKQAFAQEAQAAGPNIAFTDQGVGQASEDGTFTGLLFQVEGQGIAKVSASIDKGELYRVTRTQITQDEMQKQMDAGTWGNGDSPRSVHMVFDDDDDHATMTDDYCEPLGASFEDDYDAQVPYGFFLPADVLDPDDPAYEEDAGKQFFHDAFDAFDGATLAITVTYEDGGQATQSYKLASGKLKVKEGAEGEPMQVLQEFEDNPDANAYIYGLLATLQ